MISSAIWNKKHEYIFQRPKKEHEPLIHVTGELHSFLTQSELSNVFVYIIIHIILQAASSHCI